MRGQISLGMAERGDEPDKIRARLKALPEALGYPTQDTLAQALGITVSRYREAISQGSLSRGLAFAIYSQFPGMRIEWLWFGDRSMMPAHLLAKLDTAMGSDPTSRNGTGARSRKRNS